MSQVTSSPMAIADTALQLLAQGYSTLEVRTAASPPIKISIADLAGGPPSPTAQALKPTLILSGRLGVHTIAPYGVATSSGGYVLGAAVVGFFALGVLLGRALKE